MTTNSKGTDVPETKEFLLKDDEYLALIEREMQSSATSTQEPSNNLRYSQTWKRIEQSLEANKSPRTLHFSRNHLFKLAATVVLVFGALTAYRVSTFNHHGSDQFSDPNTGIKGSIQQNLLKSTIPGSIGITGKPATTSFVVAPGSAVGFTVQLSASGVPILIVLPRPYTELAPAALDINPEQVAVIAGTKLLHGGQDTEFLDPEGVVTWTIPAEGPNSRIKACIFGMPDLALAREVVRNFKANPSDIKSLLEMHGSNCIMVSGAP